MPRKRRKNADDDIRRLERKAQETLAPVDIIAYWKACLRAGIEPKPTYTEAWDEGVNKLVWTLYPTEYIFGTRAYPRVIHYTDTKVYALMRGRNVRIITEDVEHVTLIEGIKAMLVAAQAENPRKKRSNGDDDIRRLERQMLTTLDPQDVLRYWAACVKAKVLPLAETRISFEEKKWLRFPESIEKLTYPQGEMKYYWDVEPSRAISDQEDETGLIVDVHQDRLMIYFSRYNKVGALVDEGAISAHNAKEVILKQLEGILKSYGY